jgi:hypothetical protein
MNSGWIRHLPGKSCKNFWDLKNNNKTPQEQMVENFCNQHQILDRVVVDSCPDSSHDMISLVINQSQFVSVQELDFLLIECMSKAKKFLHLAVNKFLLYTQQDQCLYETQSDLDLRLVLHWRDLIDQPLIFCHYCSEDRGSLGNFRYPITQLIWKIND